MCNYIKHRGTIHFDGLGDNLDKMLLTVNGQVVIKQIKDTRDELEFFEKVSLPAEDEKTQEIIKNFPTVYVHNWQETGGFEVYVGESNDIFKRKII